MAIVLTSMNFGKLFLNLKKITLVSEVSENVLFIKSTKFSPVTGSAHIQYGIKQNIAATLNMFLQKQNYITDG